MATARGPTYLVFSAYYKHGETQVTYCGSEAVLRHHLIQSGYYDLTGYYDDLKDDDEDDDDDDEDDDEDDGPNTIHELSTPALIELALEHGAKQIWYQYGWGVVQVTRIGPDGRVAFFGDTDVASAAPT